jgi:N-acetylmuramoyl-L-alanine amidase
MKPRRMDMTDGDVDKESKFWVLVGTKMPATLFELEFIHTLEGARFLMHPNNQVRMAEALAAGVARHFLTGGEDAVKTALRVKVAEIQQLIGKL